LNKSASILIAVVMSLFFSQMSFAMTKYDMTLGDELMVGKEKLSLKAMTRREVNILGIVIRVYVAGLYVADTKFECPEIIKSSKTRVVSMNFLRHVSSGDLAGNLKEGIEKNCTEHCDEQKEKAKEIKKLVPSPDKGDVLKITFDDKGTGFDLNNKVLGRVEGVEFSQTLLSAFIGNHPPTEEFKAGLCDAPSAKK
jgi:hypothetical protein